MPCHAGAARGYGARAGTLATRFPGAIRKRGIAMQISPQDNPSVRKKRRGPRTIGLSFFVIGLMVLLITIYNRSDDADRVPDEGELLIPAASTSFGDLAPITVDHAKVRMLAPKGWMIAPRAGLASKGRGLLALLPAAGPTADQSDLPILYVYNYNEFPIYDDERSSLYKEGMTVMEWAAELATNGIFSDAGMPVELHGGGAVFDARIQGYSCICGVSLANAPMLLYFQMPAEWIMSNSREMEYIRKDLADIVLSLEALE